MLQKWGDSLNATVADHSALSVTSAALGVDFHMSNDLETKNPLPTPGTAPVGAQDGSSPTQAGLFEKIHQLGSGLYEKYGTVFKQGRGRPRKDGAPKISDVAVDRPPSAIPALALGPAPLLTPPPDEEMAVRCIAGIIKGYISVKDSRLFDLAVQATKQTVWAKNLVSKTTATADEIDNFTRNLVRLLQKWGVNLSWLPEVSVLVDVIKVEMRYRSAISEIQAWIAEQKAAQQKMAA